MASSSSSDSDSDDEQQQTPTMTMTTTQQALAEDSDNDSSSSSSESDDESSSSSSSDSDSDSDEASPSPSNGASDPAAAAAIAAAVAEAANAEAKRRVRREARQKARADKRDTQNGTASTTTTTSTTEKYATPTSLLNPQIASLNPDYYYHLGLSSSAPLREQFGDVRFVLMQGSSVRAAETIRKVQVALNIPLPVGTALSPIGKTERYSMYKCGPVLSVSHGMGKPSISILLHEITKMLAAAGVLDKVTYIRVGTSGGLGCDPGTVVVSSGTVNGALDPNFPVVVLGQTIYRPCRISSEIVEDIMSASSEAAAAAGSSSGSSSKEIKTISGLTMATDDFYEGQGRLDGAICEYTLEDKMDFIRKAHAAGVKNIEMESDAIVAFCTKLHIKCAVICATIVNRLLGDQVNSTPEQLVSYSDNAVNVAIRYIQKQLHLKPGKEQRSKLARRQAASAKALSGEEAVPAVAGSGTDFTSTRTSPQLGSQTRARAQTKTQGGKVAVARSASTKQPRSKKQAPDTPASASQKKRQTKTAGGAPTTPRTPRTPKQPTTPSNKKPRKQQTAPPQTPAPASVPVTVPVPTTPIMATHVQQPPQTPVAVAATASTGGEQPLSRKKRKMVERAIKQGLPIPIPTMPATPTPASAQAPLVAPATPAAAPVAVVDADGGVSASAKKPRKQKKQDQAAAATAAATPVPVESSIPTAAGEKPGRRQRKKALDDARASTGKSAAAAAEAPPAIDLVAAKQADLEKFDPDAAAALASGKKKRPNKSDRKKAAEATEKAAREEASTTASAATTVTVTPTVPSTPAPLDAQQNKKKRKKATAAEAPATTTATVLNGSTGEIPIMATVIGNPTPITPLVNGGATTTEASATTTTKKRKKQKKNDGTNGTVAMSE